MKAMSFLLQQVIYTHKKMHISEDEYTFFFSFLREDLKVLEHNYVVVPGMQMWKVISSEISLILFLHGRFHPGPREADQEKDFCQGKACVLPLRRVSKIQR